MSARRVTRGCGRGAQVSTTVQRRHALRRTVLACIAGNLIEWYEVSVYGFLVSTLAGNFFTPAGGICPPA